MGGIWYGRCLHVGIYFKFKLHKQDKWGTLKHQKIEWKQGVK